MLTVEQAFKFGFLRKCASLGLSDEAMERVAARAQQYFDQCQDKRAFTETLTGAAKSLVGGAQTAASWATPALTAIAIGAPVLGGYGLGTAAGRINDVDDTDIDEIKKREIIEAYNRAAAQAQPKPQQPARRSGRR